MSLADLALDGFKGGKQRLQLCMSRNNSVDPEKWFIAGVRACQGISNPHLKDARIYRRLLPEHAPYLDVLVHATGRSSVFRS